MLTLKTSTLDRGNFFNSSNQPPKANSAFHPSGVGKWVTASAGKTKAGMVHSFSAWTRGMQVKLWDPLRTHAIPERLRGVFTTRRCTNPLTFTFTFTVCIVNSCTFWSNYDVPWSWTVVQTSILWPSKYVKIRFRPGLWPGPHGGSSQRSPDLLVSWGTPLSIHHPTRHRPTFGARRASPRISARSTPMFTRRKLRPPASVLYSEVS